MTHSYNDAFYELVKALQPLYDAQEATAMAHIALQHITGMDKLQRLIHKTDMLTDNQQVEYEQMKMELLNSRPLQYVIGQAWFMGLSFNVNEDVLIPRPETEELVLWVIDEWRDKETVSILDIGSGSGCIPSSLKLAMKHADVSSVDVSESALTVAIENSKTLNAAVQFKELDFLDRINWQELGSYDVIISNPPYIPAAEKKDMHANVTGHEPALALFVPDEDALVFYRAIAEFGLQHLKDEGAIYCELHRDYALQSKELFEQAGYSMVAIRNDMHGNPRMLRAKR